MYSKKIVCLLMACAMLFACLPAWGEEKDAFVWENERFVLSLNEADLIFSVYSKATGKTLTSALSAPDKSLNKQWKDFLCSSLSIEYAEETSNGTTRIGSTSGKWDVKAIEDGFCARITFEECGIALDMEVALEEDGLTMKVPADSITESGEFLLCGVYLAPGFGATFLGEEEGYHFLPEAAGAIVEYPEEPLSISAPYSKMVWGENTGSITETTVRYQYPSIQQEEKILMPIYGFAYTDSQLAALCILESGQDCAQIMAYASGIVTQYNFICAQYFLREKYFKLNTSSRGTTLYEEDMQARDLVTRVILLEGEKANYNGMAASYRNYLIEREEMTAREKQFSIRLDFLGAETRKGLMWNTVVPVTTVSQMSQILKAYMELQIAPVNAYYWGWQRGGKTEAYGTMPNQMEGQLGSIGDVKALAAELSENESSLSLMANLTHAYMGRSYGHDQLARRLNKQMITFYTNHMTYREMYALSPNYTKEMAKALSAFAGQDVGIGVESTGSVLFSYSSINNSRYNRGEAAGQYQESFGLLNEKGNLSLTNPLACYLGEAAAYLNFPTETTNYTMISRSVPFLSMVIDGLIPSWGEYLNDESDLSYALLKMIEYGVMPSWQIIGSDSSVLRDTNSDDVFSASWDVFSVDIEKIGTEMKALWDKIGNGRMIAHDEMENGLIRLTYDNGLMIYINYQAKSLAVEGNADDVVPAKGYLVRGGEGA